MPQNTVTDYLSTHEASEVSTAFIAYLAALDQISSVDPSVSASIVKELSDQRSNLKLIASENYSSLPSQLAMGNLFTDKYAEGYPDHRFYAGCDNVDTVENRAAKLAESLFGAEHAYVQPHSGADANLIAYWAILNTRVEIPALEKLGEPNPSHLGPEDWGRLRAELGNQRLLGLDYYSGGHLTHGYRHNVSAQMFDAYTYSVDPDTMLLDYDAIEKMANEIKPLILLTGYSAYPRKIDFRRMRQIADSVGSVFMVDMAHFAGLVAGKVFTGDFDPVAHAHVVTTTTHKTLRGPRGGMVLCTEEFAPAVDKGCPLVIGGPLPHVIAAKAVAFSEASNPDFAAYAAKIVDNSRALAAACAKKGMTVTTGGTDNHLFLVDVRSFGLNGRQAETAVRRCGITLNRNSIPFDSNGPWYTSGLRIGTPAVTTLGMGENEMSEIADILSTVLHNTKPAIQKSGKNTGENSRSRIVLEPGAEKDAQAALADLMARFPVYPELDLEYLSKVFAD